MDGVRAYFQRIQKGASLNFLVAVGNNFGIGFAEYFFLRHGVAFYKLILIYAISPLVSLPIVSLCNNYKIQRYMRYGILGYIGMALSLLFYSPYSWFLFAIFQGLNLAFFWVSFNYIFFSKSRAANSNAKDSSIYFILGPLAGIVLPPLGALVIGGIGYRALFFITILLFLLPLAYTKSKEFDLHATESFTKAHKAFKGLRTIVFFDGTLHYFQGNFLALYALLFLKTQYQVGGLLSYLALISLAASFFLSHFSDKSKKRVEILYPILIVMSILILIIPSLKDLSALIVVGGIYAILDNLSLPIRFAVPMDLAKADIGFWRVNEFYGNIGRTTVFGVAALLLYMGDKWGAFAIFAVMTFLFPFIISRKSNLLRHTNT